MTDQERAKRYPLWACPTCPCQRNWASRLTCHQCAEKRPKIKPTLVPPSIRVRPQALPPQSAPRPRRPLSPSAAESPLLTQVSQASVPTVHGHKEIEATIKKLKTLLATLEPLAEEDPAYYAHMLLTTQKDLASAVGALQRSKPIAAQLTSCLSKKTQADKLVDATSRELVELEAKTEEKRAENRIAIQAQVDLEVELQRLSALNVVPSVGPAAPSAIAALQSFFTPSMAEQLNLLVNLLLGPEQAAVSALLGKVLLPTGLAQAPPGEGTVTPRASCPTTPHAKEDRGAGVGAMPGKSRSRSPTERKGEVSVGFLPGGFQIEGLTKLQVMLGLIVAGSTPVEGHDADMKEDEL